MLGQTFELPSWLTPEQVEAAQQAAATITTGTDNTPVYASTDQSYLLINADDYFGNPSYSRFDASGYSIAILDTGADLDHPAFGPDSNSDGVADRIVYQWDYVNNDNNASDDNGHGTHVASIAAGLASGANLIVLKVLDQNGSGSFTGIQSALQWIIGNAGLYNIASVNMSLGDGGNYATDQTSIISDELAFLDDHLRVTPVAAAGNFFRSFNSAPGVAYPAADASVMSIGASYDANVGGLQYPAYGGAADFTTAADRVASFSQRHGEMLDIFAPGTLITAAGLNGSSVTRAGTSMAAPHVAAAVALAHQINQTHLGTSRLTKDELANLFQDTGVSIIDGDDENDNVINTGLAFERLDLLAMTDALLPPSVIDVVLDGSTWARDPYSFADIVPTGKQLAPIFTQGVDTIRIEFSEHVVINGSELTLYATNVVDPNPITISHTGFSYDSNNHVASWTFPTLAADKYRIELSTAVVDADGNPLDAEWENVTDGIHDNFFDGPTGRTLVSGDGDNDGGAFQFLFSYLPGDYNRDGKVDTADYILYFHSDGDGDGVVGGQGDYNVWSANFGNKLPFFISMGDYDDNEIVDGNDYLVWRSMFGSTGSGLIADGNGDGKVDAADYVIWRSNVALRSAWFIGLTGSSWMPWTIAGAAPQVTNVTMRNSTGMHNPYSFDTVDGSGEQLRTVPVGGLDILSITFSEEVLLLASDLTLTGLQGQLIPTISDFTYDPNSQTATWRFETALDHGQYLMRLSDSVTDLDEDSLDGEFTNPWSLNEAVGYASTFPSGDGQPGGEFRFRFTNLPADFSHNNIVDNPDWNIWYANEGIYTTEHGDGDADGDGYVGSNEYVILGSQHGTDYTRWPSVEPGMILVSNATDESDANYSYGDLSLREALTIAANAAGTDKIVFDPAISQILLTLGQLTINSNVAIASRGVDTLTIDAQGNSRVFIVNSGISASISGLTITGGGSVTNGGGVYVAGNLTVDSAMIQGNLATQRGGGIYIANTGTLRLTDSTVDNNDSERGGGIFGSLKAGAEVVRIENSTISNNRALIGVGYGGGIMLDHNSSTTTAGVLIANSTVSNNEANNSGGIRARYAGLNMQIVNSTIAYNKGNDSGGIHVLNNAVVTLHNTIIAENTLQNGSARSIFGGLQSSSSYNLIGPGGSGGLTHGTNGNIVLTAGQTAGLAPLDNYGGPTKTHALLQGSFAIDAGDDAIASLFGLLKDQRRKSRFADGDLDSLLRVDIGAFELAADEYFGSV